MYLSIYLYRIINHCNMSNFTMKYNMNVHFVDNLLHKQIPLDIVNIIAEYTYPTKKQLFNEIKDNIKNKTPSMNYGQLSSGQVCYREVDLSNDVDQTCGEIGQCGSGLRTLV